MPKARDALKVEWWATDRPIPYAANARVLSDVAVGKVAASIKEYGWRQPIVVDEEGVILAGHTRLQAAQKLRLAEVPVHVAAGLTKAQAKAFRLMDNRSAQEATWDVPLLQTEFEALRELGIDLALTGFDNADFERFDIEGAILQGDVELGGAGKPERRALPLDVIFTMDSIVYYHLAAASGVLIGIQSKPGWLPEGHRAVKKPDWMTISFIDNDFKDYDHGRHKEIVSIYRPKYCTVRDYLSPLQCEDAGIAYYDLDRILGWAEELQPYVEHVIVIPKVDVVKEVPEEYVLGYSVPSSYGQTPLPPSAFVGRRVHLLGGSWRSQLRYLTYLGDDVVALDFNHAANIAQWGQFTTRGGKSRSLRDIGVDVQSLSFDHAAKIAEEGLFYVRGGAEASLEEAHVDVANVIPSAITLSLGAILADLRELFGQEPPSTVPTSPYSLTGGVTS